MNTDKRKFMKRPPLTFVYRFSSVNRDIALIVQTKENDEQERHE